MQQKQVSSSFRGVPQLLAVTLATLALGAAPTVAGAQAQRATALPVQFPVSMQPVVQTVPEAAPLVLSAGKATVLRLPERVDRISVGNPAIADITLLRPNELYLLGKSFGTTNVILWRSGGRTTTYEVQVGIEVAPLRNQIRELWPQETDVKVSSAATSIVLSGGVTSAPVAEQIARLARAYVGEINRVVQAGSATNEVRFGQSSQSQEGAGASASTTVVVAQPGAGVGPGIGLGGQGAGGGGSATVVNLLQVLNPQQVMLEVKVAEINRTFLESLGVNLSATGTSGSVTLGLLSNMVADIGALGSGNLSVTGSNPLNNAKFKAQNSDALVKVLAEPNILAISGQEGQFLAGGRILVPVAQQSAGGAAAALQLEEKEFGVGLKFTPTVLENGRIHLKVAPEVSELVQRSLSGAGTVLPQFTSRRASTTVQLMDGQSLAIAGLIKNNATQNISRFPFLGEIPILGALFRSSDFVNERSELVFIVTPRLVKPLPANYRLPTDNFVPPSRYDFLLGGKLEGERRARSTVGYSTSVTERAEGVEARPAAPLRAPVTAPASQVQPAPAGSVVVVPVEAQAVTPVGTSAATPAPEATPAPAAERPKQRRKRVRKTEPKPEAQAEPKGAQQ